MRNAGTGTEPNKNKNKKKNEEEKKKKQENALRKLQQEEALKRLQQASAFAEMAKVITANRNKTKKVSNNKNKSNNVYFKENYYQNSSGRYRSIPETTPYFNRSLRRFLYKPSIGFYIILGLDRDGKVIKRRVPGHFYYRLDPKLQRIIPYSRRLARPPPVKQKKKTGNNNNNNNSKGLSESEMKLLKLFRKSV